MEPTGTEHVGAAGHFISALLQTAGLFGQDAVLEHMTPMLEQVGMMVYAYGIICALAAIALFSNYRNAIYLLIGPPLFLFMLHTRVEVQGVPIQMGAHSQTGSVEDQRALLTRVGHTTDSGPVLGNAEVSWFFVLYDDMVSQIVHNCAALLLDDSRRIDLINAGKERVYSHIGKWQASNAGFIKLLVRGMTEECGEASKLGRELKSRVWDPADPAYTEREANRQELLARLSVNLSRETDVQEYLTHRLTPALDSEDWTELKTCQQIWDWTFAAARAEATRLEMDIDDKNKATDGNPIIPWDEVWDEIEAASADDPDQMLDLLAAIFIRNTLKFGKHSAIVSALSERSDFNQARFAGKYAFLSQIEAKAHYQKMMYFAGAIPYFQGLLLYLLCLAFPFFCVFLILPGRVSSFVTWMGMWIWVKSWDVGFAFVYSVRGILQNYMFGDLHESLYSSPGVEIDFTDPSAIEEIMTMYDPMATEGTYTFIICLLTCSVPAVTAHLCMGASNITSFLQMSIDKRADRFYADARGPAVRDQAARMHMEIKAKRLAFANERGKWAEKNPGQAISANRSGDADNPFEIVDRNKTGDATHASFIGSQMDEAFYKFGLTKGFADSHALLGSLTGRRMTFNNGRKGIAESSVQNQILEQYYGRMAGMGHYLGSDKAQREMGSQFDFSKDTNIMGSDGE